LVIRDVVEFRRCSLAYRRVAELNIPVDVAGRDTTYRPPRGHPVHTFFVPHRVATAVDQLGRVLPIIDGSPLILLAWWDAVS
jgi:hypothetical protein